MFLRARSEVSTMGDVWARMDPLPRRRIAELGTASAAKLVGRVEALGEPLVAPISGRPCVAWFTFVGGLGSYEEDMPERVGEHHRAAAIQPFLLRDESGVASIDPDDCLLGVLPTSAANLPCRELNGAIEAERADALMRATGSVLFVQIKGLYALRLLGLKPVVFETAIGIGDEVWVAGHCTPEQTAAAAPFRDQARARVAATREQELLISIPG